MNGTGNEPHVIRDATDAGSPKDDAGLSAVGEPCEEIVEGDERLRVQVLVDADGRFAYRAQCRYEACDGAFRDTLTSTERYDSESEAMAAGRVRARQLAGIDVPEA